MTFLALAHTCLAQQNTYFQNISVNEGLSQNNVIAIIEDLEGFMWFATKSGLNRYDGNTIKVFEKEEETANGLVHSRLNCLSVDYQDRIWIGTEGKGLTWYDKKTERFHLINSHNSSEDFNGDNIRDIITDKEKKTLWVVTERGLYEIDAESLQSKPLLLGPLKPSEVSSTFGLFKDRMGRFIIGVRSKGLLVLNPDNTFTTVYDERVNTSINGFVQNDDGNIWIATEDRGVVIMDEHSFELSFPLLQQDDALASRRLLSMAKDDDGNILIGTENGGLDIFDQATGRLVNYSYDPEDQYSLRNNSIFSICLDQSGRMWLGTFNKGVCYRDQYAIKFKTHKERNTPNSLSSNAVSGFALGKDSNEIWISTDGGGINRWDRKANTFEDIQHKKNSRITSDAVLTVYKQKAKGHWFGTWGGGLLFRDQRTGVFENYQQLQNQGDRPLHVFQFLEDDRENLWLATFDRGLCYYNLKTNTITSYFDREGKRMNSYLATCLIETKDNNLWVGTGEGLHRFTFSSDGEYGLKVYLQSRKEIPNDYIQTLFIDRNDRLWVATGGGGLCLYQPESDSFKVFNRKSGLPSNEIFAIQEDHDGLFWISSSKGLFRFNPKTYQIKVFDKKDGLQDLSFFKNASLQLPSGELLFGGVAGFNVFHPKNIEENPDAPKLYFTGLKLFNKPVDIQDSQSLLKAPLEYTNTLELDYTESVFTIEYVGINMTHPQKNQYAYMLDGFENDWNYVGNTTNATYTNLDGGTYTFLLKAANNDGVWTEKPKSLVIVVHPPWWETLLFRAGALLILVVGGVSFYRMRVRTLKRQKEKLEKKVSERTHELVEKQNEITTQNEELVQQSEEILSQRDVLQEQHQKLEETFGVLKERNMQIMDSIRYAENIQQAILPSQERIDKLFEHYFIIYEPKDIVSGDFYWATERSGYIFLAVIDCTGHGVPGAFMSMIGNTLLNRIVKEQDEYEPAKVLEKLNVGVRRSLRQSTSKNTDGMDAALIRLKKIDEGKYEARFAGAKGNLYLFQEENNYCSQIIKGTRRSIGAIYNEGARYQEEVIVLKENDVFILTSDGIIDLEVTKGKRFGTTCFVALAEKTEGNLIKLQQDIEQKVAVSRQKFPLRDDIAIIGVKL